MSHRRLAQGKDGDHRLSSVRAGPTSHMAAELRADMWNWHDACPERKLQLDRYAAFVPPAFTLFG
jgi:hypothetical protein